MTERETNMRMSFGITATTAAALALAACGAPAQSEAESQRAAEDYAASFGIDADISTTADGSERVEIRSATGGLSGSNLAVPDDFPTDVPIYPDLNISAVNNVGPTRMIQGIARNSVEEVATFYLAQMPARGWTASGDEQPTPAMRMMQFTKGERTAGVSITATGPGASVALTTMGG